MKKEIFGGLAIGLLLVGIASTAQAELIKGTWTADVGLVSGPDALDIFGSMGSTVSSVSWSVVYDNESEYWTHYYDDTTPWSQQITISDTGLAYTYMADAVFTFDENITNFFNLNEPVNTQRYAYQSAYSTSTYQDYYLYGAYLDVYNNTSSSSGHLNIVYTPTDPNLINTQKVYLKNITFSEAAAPVPVPPTMLLFGTGLVGLIGPRLRKKKK